MCDNDDPKIEFEKQKLCYEQNFLQFRSLNQEMWQVPIIAMTLTGGLWYAVGTIDSLNIFKVLLLLLAAFGNIALIFVLYRVGYVMYQYLEKIKNFYPKGYVEAPGTNILNGKYAVIMFFSGVLLISSFCSVYGIYEVFDMPTDSKGEPLIKEKVSGDVKKPPKVQNN